MTIEEMEPYFEFLSDLKKAGTEGTTVVVMDDGAAYLRATFGLDREKARLIFSQWKIAEE